MTHEKCARLIAQDLGLDTITPAVDCAATFCVVSGLGLYGVEPAVKFTRAFYKVRTVCKNYFRGLSSLEEAISDTADVMSEYDFTPNADLVSNIRLSPEEDAWWILFEAIG